MEPAAQGTASPTKETYWLYLVGLILLPFLLFADALMSANKVIGGDSLYLYWPDLVYAFNSLKAGHFPLWDPYERAGDPFLFDPQNGLFYIGNHVLLIVAALWGSLPHAFQEWKILAHLALGGAGMFLFLRRALDLDSRAALCGALLFLLQPYFASHIRHILLLPAAYLPWMLLFLHDLRQEGRPSSLGWFVLAGGSAILCGSPPATWYTFLAVGLYGLFLTIRPGGTISRVRFAVLAFSGAALSLLSGAVLWLPAMQHIPLSVVQDRSFGYLSASSLNASGLMGLILQGHPNEEIWVYFGVLPFALAILAPFSSKQRHLSLFLWAVALFFLAVAVGRDFPLFRWLSHLPGFDLFRHPVRYVLLAGMALSMLGAIGLSVLYRLLEERLHSWPRRVVPWLLLAFVGGTFVATLGPPMRAVALQTLPHDPAMNPPSLARMNGLSDRWRLLDDGLIGTGVGDRMLLRDFRGYATNFVYFRWAEARKALKVRPDLLGLWNVRYYGPNPKDVRATVPRIHTVKGWKKLMAGLYENRDTWPAAFWVSSATALKDHRAVLQRLRTKGATKNHVFLERDLLPNDEGFASRLREIVNRHAEPETMVEAKRVRFSPNETEVDIVAPGDGFVVLNETWYPGWTATVDENPVPVFPANYLQRAVWVPQGAHRVRFTFDPPVFVPAFGLTLLGLASALLLLTWTRWRRRFRCCR